VREGDVDGDAGKVDEGLGAVVGDGLEAVIGEGLAVGVELDAIVGLGGFDFAGILDVVVAGDGLAFDGVGELVELEHPATSIAIIKIEIRETPINDNFRIAF